MGEIIITEILKMEDYLSTEEELLEYEEPVPDETEELNFKAFITQPVAPFDILVSNNKIAFQSHKNVLRKISTVFDDFISGDNEIKKITLRDISNENIKLLK